MNPNPIPQPNCPETCRVTNHIPMAHVVDVDHSVRFYTLLGFECDSRFSGEDGRTNWASLVSVRAKLFLARASGPINPADQAVLFYMYSPDIMGLRMHLLAQGLADGGRPPGECAPNSEFLKPDGSEAPGDSPPPVRLETVFRPTFPFYMSAGEIRIHDPDGYVILVGQLDR